MEDKVMKIGDLAKYLIIKPRTIYRLVGEGKIPGVKFGGQWRFHKDEIDGLFQGDKKK